MTSGIERGPTTGIRGVDLSARTASPVAGGRVLDRGTGLAARACARRPKWWVLAKEEGCGVEVLTTEAFGEEALAVFGFEEEAEMFSCLGGGSGWQAKETSPGELVSLLCGPYARVGTVVVDPLPGVCGARAVRSLCVGRAGFVGVLLGERGPRSRRPPRGRKQGGVPWAWR
jgi:hypothetical protein